MERIKPVKNFDDGMINELSGLAINGDQTREESPLEKQIIPHAKDEASTEKYGEVSSDDGNEDPTGKSSTSFEFNKYHMKHETKNITFLKFTLTTF